MRGLVIRWLALTVAVIFTAYLVDGIRVDSFGSALAAAAAIGILNAFFRPIALLLTLPLNLLTFGLFTFVINALMLKMADGLIEGLQVDGFWSAVAGAFLIGLISWLINTLINTDGRIHVIELHRRGPDRWV